MIAMATEAPATNAVEIVAAALAKKARRLDREDGYDWADLDAFRRYVAVLQSVKVWKVDNNTVAASVVNTRDGRMWSYVAAEIMDVDTSDEIWRNGHVKQISATTYWLQLSCDCGTHGTA